MFKHRLKQVIKKLISLSGLHHVLWNYIPNGVYVFNYHRIGDKNKCLFDREVFSCSTKSFEEQCLFIQSNFEIITLDELDSINAKPLAYDKKYALVTFDDGYIDNYTQAFPILKKHNIPATFYVPTDFVGNDLIPWWDEIAYLLRKSEGETYSLPNQLRKFYLNIEAIESTISRIIYDAKRLEGITVIDVLNDVRLKFPQALIEFEKENHTLFMNWEQLSKMASHNMKIGSHTLSHQVLSQLSEKEQERELIVSKDILEKKLLTRINSVVYPVGRKHCYTKTTCSIAKQAGYDFGFNNEAGRITKVSDPHDLNRFCVGSESVKEIKLEILFNL